MPRWSELRRKLLVDRHLQGRLILRVVAYWGVYHAALWHAVFLVRYVQHRLQGLSGMEVPSFSDQYVSALRDSQALLVAAALLLPAIVWETLRQSHRIAGPLYRFQATLKALMGGATPAPIRLRRGDLLRSFEQTMNEFLEFYAQRQEDSTDAESPASTNRPKVARTTV